MRNLSRITSFLGIFVLAIALTAVFAGCKGSDKWNEVPTEPSSSGQPASSSDTDVSSEVESESSVTETDTQNNIESSSAEEPADEPISYYTEYGNDVFIDMSEE